jgi:hypothetical protein
MDGDSTSRLSGKGIMVASGNLDIVFGFTFTAQTFCNAMKNIIGPNFPTNLPKYDDVRYPYLKSSRTFDHDAVSDLRNKLYARMESLLPTGNRWSGDGPFWQGGFFYADDTVTIYFGQPVIEFNGSDAAEGITQSKPFDPAVFNTIAARYQERATILRGEYEKMGLEPTEVGWKRVQYTN